MWNQFWKVYSVLNLYSPSNNNENQANLKRLNCYLVEFLNPKNAQIFLNRLSKLYALGFWKGLCIVSISTIILGRRHTQEKLEQTAVFGLAKGKKSGIGRSEINQCRTLFHLPKSYWYHWSVQFWKNYEKVWSQMLEITSLS